MKVRKLLFTFLLLTLIISCGKDNVETNLTDDLSNESVSHRENGRPWIFIANPILSRDECMNGPGICFQNEDGDILVYSVLTGDMGGVIHGISGRIGTDVVGYQRNENQLNLLFSRGLGEDSLIITEDVVLRGDISRSFGVEKITIPAGEYVINVNEAGYVESAVPIVVEEVRLDYHSQYGHIETWDFQVGRSTTLNDFLEGLNITENDLVEYQISEKTFTGIAYVEHLINGENIYVWHEYSDEQISAFEAELVDGSRVSSLRINACGNMMQWEVNELIYLLDKYAWFFFGYV